MLSCATSLPRKEEGTWGRVQEPLWGQQKLSGKEALHYGPLEHGVGAVRRPHLYIWATSSLSASRQGLGPGQTRPVN